MRIRAVSATFGVKVAVTVGVAVEIVGIMLGVEVALAIWDRMGVNVWVGVRLGV